MTKSFKEKKLSEFDPMYSLLGNLNSSEREDVLVRVGEVIDQATQAEREKTLSEILKYVQEDLDFGASKQQIVSTKAQSMILVELNKITK